MRFGQLSAAAAAVIALSSVASFGATVTSLGGGLYTASWHTLGTSSGSATISTEQPRSGNASLRLETNGDKAAATFGGDRFFSFGTLGTFGDLINGSIGFEFYRDPSSDVAAHLAPALEISFANGANLKWEAVYNGFPVVSPVAEGQWYSVNLTGTSGTFYQYNGSTVLSGGAQANLTLAEWLDANVGNDFTASTAIRGISIQAGSGWAGHFVGYVDNVYVNFGSGNGNISANFETAAVPTPAAATAGAALFGIGLLGRKRR